MKMEAPLPQNSRTVKETWQTLRIFNTDRAMEFGLEKCSAVAISQGKSINSNEIEIQMAKLSGGSLQVSGNFTVG